MMFAVLLVLVLVLFAVPAWCRLAPRLRLIDVPDSRKPHHGTIPLVGGLAIFSVVIPAILICVPLGLTAKLSLVLGLLTLLILGAVDDRRPVDARMKFALHFAASALIVWGGGAVLYSMGNLFGFGLTDFGWFAPFFTLACGVYMINAMNMIDGMDGLGGGTAFVILGWFCILALLGGMDALALLSAISLAGVAGFLWYNMRHQVRPRAVVFLGDAGSMSLGLLITFLAVTLSQNPQVTVPPITFAFIVALPIWDSFGLLVMRLRAGRPPFAPDNGHFHHHFLAAGFTPEQATPLILSYVTLLGAFGVLGAALGVPEFVLTIVWIIGWMGHAWLTCHPAAFTGFLERLRD